MSMLSKARSWPASRTWQSLAVILLLGATFLRLWGISRESIDLDELFTYRAATVSESEAMSMICNDLVHPPAYYHFVRLSVWLGGANVMSVRLVSLAAALLTIALLLFVSRKLDSLAGATWMAAILLASNNAHIYYSQQARSPALFTLLVCGLLVWSWLLAGCERSVGYWCFGAFLMVLIVYVHYFGVLYVGCVTAGVALGSRSSLVRKRIFAIAGLAYMSMLPWLALEYGVYKNKQGLQENLGWTGAPDLYALKFLWASYMGVPDIPAGTTIAAAFGVLLIAIALVYRERTTAMGLVLWTLVLTAVLPPLILFGLSLKPFALLVFGERNLVPSILGWLILAGYGVSRISVRTNRFVAGGLGCALLAMQLIPTISAMRTAPRRLPYADIASEVQGDSQIYATIMYEIGDPVNFYLRGPSAVRLLPDATDSLPDALTLLYRPAIAREKPQVDRVIASGWTMITYHDYHNGANSSGFVRVAQLRRIH